MPELQAQLLVTHRHEISLISLKRAPRSSIVTSLLVVLCFVCSLATCTAQSLINGQLYTHGLAIIDAPAPNSQQHVGSTMPIAIEISGNGKLPTSAFTPDSGLASSYELLEIYLVSSQTGLNLTISSGPGLLTGESGTVRHLNAMLPSCVPAGEYNLTFYETSHINSTPYFTITPIPISILSNRGSSPSCTEGVNALQAQPQPDINFGQSPFLPDSEVVVNTGGLGLGTTSTESHTTQPDFGSTSWTATGPTTFIEGPAPTESPMSSGSVTLVIVAQTVATTTNNQNEPITTSYMVTRTTTVPMNSAVNAGVIPINAGMARLDRTTGIFVPLLVTAWAITLIQV